MIKNITCKALAAIAIAFGLSACSDNDYDAESTETQTTCTMHFDAGFSDYGESTRAAADYTWPDGSTLYIRFKTGSRIVLGRAVYGAAKSEWVVNYYGSLQKNDESECEIYYFSPAGTVADNVASLSFSTAVYEALDAVYTLTESDMYITALLMPKMARLRFKGTAGTAISVSGLSYNRSFNLEKAVYEQNSVISCTVLEDGYTPYIYGTFKNLDDPTIAIINLDNDLYEYTRTFESSIMNPGRTGWLSIPTLDSNRGWIVNERPERVLRVTSDSVYSIGTHQAKACGTITDLGSDVEVLQCGHVWSTTQSPTIDSQSKTELGRCNSATSFESTLLNLEYGTTYYIRAYARTDSRVVYGSELSFTTQSIYAPSLSATSVSDITATAASLNASVTSDGNGTIKEAGFCYSTNINPTTLDNKLSCGAVMTMKAQLSELSPKTTYYVRAYAINEKGVNYGEQASFKTGGARPDGDGNPPVDF